MGSNNWNKFRLLMWKNWRLQMNHKFKLLLEILLPILFSGLLILFRDLVVPEQRGVTTFEAVPIRFEMRNVVMNSIKRWEIAYYPNSKCLNDVAQFAEKWLDANNDIQFLNPNITIVTKFTVKGYDDPDELNIQVKGNRIVAAVQFDESFKSDKCPTQLSYSIRFPSELRVKTEITAAQNVTTTWKTNNLFPIFDFGTIRVNSSNKVDADPSYYNEGYLAVQHAFALGFINYFNNSTEKMPGIQIRRFPYPEHLYDILLFGLEQFVALIILMSFVYPCTQVVKSVTTEKEKQLKEVMKIMGLPNWLHWTAWFIKAYIMATISSIMIVLIVKIHWSNPNVGVLTHSEWSVLTFYLLVYCVSFVTFSFMMTSFISKANIAAAVAGLLWFINYLPYQLTQGNYPNMSAAEKLGLSLFSNTAMAYGFKLILKLEGTGAGLQWSNLFQPINADDNISVGLTLIMLLVDSAIYMLITLYVEKILPGGYGVPEKWYFPFTKKYWRPQSYIASVENYHTQSETVADAAGPRNGKIGLSIKNLNKNYGNREAVNNLSMNLYENEITVLLGHNGAGKTTTISMLTGMIPPTNGTAVIDGHDIRTNLMNARMSMGLCPQHNILFDNLTVREHIIFYSRLKGLSPSEVKAEVQKYVGLLELDNKIDTQSKKLSGGMKRKLSIAAALCGGSKVVLCDEPTSGMDPSARRALWNLLEKEKVGRTLLLTTHFMDEADILGDKIAIMSSGDLKAFGTSFDLKKTYGDGYYLICVKKNDCDPSAVTSVLQQYIPEIKVERNIGSELVYRLPNKYADKFDKMLAQLETELEQLKLDGYGISNTTLEEVFLRVGSDAETVSENQGESLMLDNITLLTGPALMWSQWKAMILKKFKYILRNYILFLIQNIMPIFFVTITVFIYKVVDPFKTLPALKFDVSEYEDSFNVLQIKDPTSSNQAMESMYKTYIEAFGSHHKYVKIDEDFQEYILKEEKRNLVKVNAKYVAGCTLDRENITSWFNAQLLHALPLSLNAIHNILIRHLSKNPSITFDVKNDPLPFSEQTKLQSINQMTFASQLASNLGFCFAFVMTMFILFQIKERVSRAKLLQFVSGVRVFTFWCTQFLVDYASYMITALLTIITIAAFQEEGFASAPEIFRTLLVFVLFGLSSLPIIYLWAFCFSDSATGFTIVSIINVFTGMALSIVIFVLKLYLDKDIITILNSIFLLFPSYLFSKALDNIGNISTTTKICQEICEYLQPNLPNLKCDLELLCKSEEFPQCCVPDYFALEEPGIGAHIIYTFGVFIAMSAILLIKEYRLLRGLITMIKMKMFEKMYKPEQQQTHLSEDDDVKAENIRISRMSLAEIKQTNLVLDEVSKYYWKFLAVNKISAAVNKFECFGLLGVNGAGKTSTFKMLTGDEQITYGQAFVKGLSINSQMNAVYREIGYCPQFDALLEDLTGREILQIFALLRGIPTSQIKFVSENLARGFGFTKHINKKVKEYSGGNKRKLSASIALIGNPSVVYLDEPTTGMDPGAKRQLWNKISQIRAAGKSIVLTSHSMEECEALCTRLAIMVNGEFKCIGSTQHLKNKFSQGLILKIKLARTDAAERAAIAFDLTKYETIDGAEVIVDRIEMDKIIQFVFNHFKEAKIKEQHQDLLTFYIPLASIKWSIIFRTMEANKKSLNIEDYSVSQTTLEEIFLAFAKYQADDTRVGQ